ncbi:hypothetical protein ACHQM5_003434 [Ranunculus cassubicifolius]
MASTKRDLSYEAEESPESKKAKITAPESHKSKFTFGLNSADCDLDFDITANGMRGQGLHEHGFAYCWSGARASLGIRGGKYMFGCKIIAEQPVEMEDTPPDQQHLCRVGISRGDIHVGNLGEDVCSFGYGGTGKFSNSSKFSDYGERFGVGDTIVCVVNLESKPLASIGFYKNGKWLGVAARFDAGPSGLGVVDCLTKERQWESGIFPHVYLKNVVVEMQFTVADGLVLEEGYEAWDCAFEDGIGVQGPMISVTKDCEVLMMVGLPAAGKTTWAENWVKEHPEKRYILLGTNLALDQMKVTGLLRKQNYGERFDLLMDRATGIFNTLLARASKTPRNFIIDQTNVYKSARKRKLRPFYLYQKIAVVVFSTPDMLKFRSEKRFKEMGKDVPAEAVNEMLANYVLPTSKDMLNSDEQFDQVWFPELSREESQRYLKEMKSALETSSNSPYPSNASLRSYASPELQKTTIVPQNLNSPAIQASCNYPVPQQVMSSAYPRLGSQGQPHCGGYGQSLYQSASSLNSYGTPMPRGRASYGEVDSSSGRSYLDPYGRHREVQSYYSTPLHERSSAYGSNYSSPRTEFTSPTSTSFSYNSPGYAPSALQIPAEPQFAHPSASQYEHSRTPYPQLTPPVPRETVMNLRDPYPYSYGTPYGTPMPPYGNVPPTSMHQSGGSFDHYGQRQY